MGGGIGQWLLFRAADRSLCLFSLVVPPGSMTPIHDHLAWGLIGIYRGTQDEEFYRPDEEDQARAPAAADGGRPLRADPAGQRLHRVRTTSDETSVSIHLLANDTGCVDQAYLRRSDTAQPRVPLGLCQRGLCRAGGGCR